MMISPQQVASPLPNLSSTYPGTSCQFPQTGSANSPSYPGQYNSV